MKTNTVNTLNVSKYNIPLTEHKRLVQRGMLAHISITIYIDGSDHISLKCILMVQFIFYRALSWQNATGLIAIV